MAELSRYHRVHKFPNGATLIYYKHNYNKTTQFRVGFIGGARMDVIPGTAHFLEHMLLKRTPELEETFINKTAKQSDVDTNGFTTSDVVMLSADTVDSNLDMTCEIYSNLLFNTKFDQKDIDLERGAIDEEINYYKDGDGSASALSTALSCIRQPGLSVFKILGKHKDIKQITEKTLQDFIDSNFVSENMVISVVSDKEFDEIKDLFEKYFASKAKSDPSKRVCYTKSKYYEPSNYVFKQKDDTRKTVELFVSFMQRKSERETNLYAYVEDYILNGFAGRLLEKLRVERGLVYSASYYPVPLYRNMALNCFEVLTSKEKAKEAYQILCDIVKEIAEKGITQQELDEMKKAIELRELERRNGTKIISPEKILYRYLEGTEVFFNNQLHKVKELTLENVNKYLKDTYSNANAFVIASGNLPKDFYEPFEMQKMLGARIPQVYYNMLDQKYYNYANNEKVSKKEAMNLLSGVDTRMKLSNLAFVQDYDVNANKALMYALSIIETMTIEERKDITNMLLTSFGLDFAVELTPVENSDKQAESEEQTEYEEEDIDPDYDDEYEGNEEEDDDEMEAMAKEGSSLEK